MSWNKTCLLHGKGGWFQQNAVLGHRFFCCFAYKHPGQCWVAGLNYAFKGDHWLLWLSFLVPIQKVINLWRCTKYLLLHLQWELWFRHRKSHTKLESSEKSAEEKLVLGILDIQNHLKFLWVTNRWILVICGKYHLLIPHICCKAFG